MIYLHVPFCRSFCTYCGFYSETVPCRKGGGEPLFDRYADRVCREIEERLPDFVAANGLPVNTLYIGGGTPSVLPANTLRRIVNHLRTVLSGSAVDHVVTENKGKCSAAVNSRPVSINPVGHAADHVVTENAPPVGHAASLVVSENEGKCSSEGGCMTFEEFTVEVNPEDVVEKGAAYVRGLLEMGVNRISMGVQSFDDGILRWMNRRHDAARAREAMRILREAGVRNVSIDLIFGLSQLSDAQWEATLDQALALEPEHLSAYQLSIEEDSALADQIAKGRYTEASEEACRRQYDRLCERMARAGFHHYEVSNFARPGFEAVHNSAYWRRIPYLGLGPGAHSAYARNPEEGVNLRVWNSCEPVNWKEAGQETLSPEQRQEETLMLGLRTSRGLPENWMRAHCDTRVLERLLAAGALEKGPEGTIRIAEHHFFVSDEIIAEL